MKIDVNTLPVGEKKYGYYFTLKDHDVFIETPRQKKTKALLEEICRELQIPDNSAAFYELKYYMRPATAEVRTISNGRKYFDFCGKNFCYGDFIDKGKTDYYRLVK